MIQSETGEIVENHAQFSKITKLEESPQHLKLVDVSQGRDGAYLIYKDLGSCSEEECYIEEIVDEGGTVVLPNSTVVIIGGNSTLTNSTLVVNGSTVVIEGNLNSTGSNIIYTPIQTGDGSPIIIDGGSIHIDGSKFIYKIEGEDIFESITDGQVITIITTSNGGQIEGTFDEVEVVMPEVEGECRKLKAEAIYE